MFGIFQAYAPQGPGGGRISLSQYARAPAISTGNSQMSLSQGSSSQVDGGGQKRKLPGWMSSQGKPGVGKKPSKMIRKNSLFSR